MKYPVVYRKIEGQVWEWWIVVGDEYFSCPSKKYGEQFVKDFQDQPRCSFKEMKGIKIPENGKEHMEPYSFISSESEIDFVRIVREANNHPFIQVDIQDRRGRSTDDIYFFVHNDILKNTALHGVKLLGDTVDMGWGDDIIAGTTLYSYSYTKGSEKDIPTFKKHVAHIKALLSPKNRKTFVTLL